MKYITFLITVFLTTAALAKTPEHPRIPYITKVGFGFDRCDDYNPHQPCYGQKAQIKNPTKRAVRVVYSCYVLEHRNDHGDEFRYISDEADLSPGKTVIFDIGAGSGSVDPNSCVLTWAYVR